MEKRLKRKEFLKEESGKMVMSFGQYAGKTLDEVAAINPMYLRWMLQNAAEMPETTKLAMEQALDNLS